jgi:hypothetical protein
MNLLALENAGKPPANDFTGKYLNPVQTGSTNAFPVSDREFTRGYSSAASL